MQVVGDAVGQDGLALAGRGLADTTRLASSPPEIWRDIAATNADEIGPGARRADRAASGSAADLPDGERLADVFTDAARLAADQCTSNKKTIVQGGRLTGSASRSSSARPGSTA